MTADRLLTATFQLAVGPPVISNIAATAGDDWATIEWTTNEPTTSSVDFGETFAYEGGYPRSLYESYREAMN